MRARRYRLLSHHMLERNRDTVAQPLMDRGLEKVALSKVPHFNPTSSANFSTLFQKDCSAPDATNLNIRKILSQTPPPLLAVIAPHHGWVYRAKVRHGRTHRSSGRR